MCNALTANSFANSPPIEAKAPPGTLASEHVWMISSTIIEHVHSDWSDEIRRAQDSIERAPSVRALVQGT